MCECLEANIVRDHDHCNLLSHVEIDEDLHDDVSAASVQITSRFVKEKNLGLVRNGAGNSYSLLLSTGQLVGEVVHSLLQTDILEKLPRSVTNLFS